MKSLKQLLVGSFTSTPLVYPGTSNPYVKVKSVNALTGDPFPEPQGSILHWDANTDPYLEKAEFGHTFNYNVLSPQYQRAFDGSYTDVGAKPAVDVFGGQKWVRSCGAVTNLLPSGSEDLTVSSWENNAMGTLVSSGYPSPSGDLGAYWIYDNPDSNNTAWFLRTFSGQMGETYTFSIMARAKQGTGAGRLRLWDDAMLSGEGDSPKIQLTEEWQRISFTNTMSSDNVTRMRVGLNSLDSIIVCNPQLTATAYPVPYVPPGVTQPASNATTTNGSWFTLPDGSELWHALDGGPETDGVELVVNGDFSDGLTGWVLHEDAQIVNGALRVNSDDVSQTSVIYASQTITALTVPATYRISFGVSQINAGKFSVVISGNPTSIVVDNITGVYSEVITVAPGSSKSLVIYGRHSFMPRDFTIDNISIQRIQPQPLTLATRVRMGLAGSDYPRDVWAPILAEKETQAYHVQDMSFGADAGQDRVVRASCSETRTILMDAIWPPNSIINRITQVNTAGTKFRVGYMIEGTHTEIQWSSWISFDGSFDPSTLYRLMLGYNNPYPMWFNKITAWKEEVSDARILDAMTSINTTTLDGDITAFFGSGTGELVIGLTMQTARTSLPINTIIYPLANKFLGFQNTGTTGQFIVSDGTNFNTVDFNWSAGQKVTVRILADGFAFRIEVA